MCITLSLSHLSHSVDCCSKESSPPTFHLCLGTTAPISTVSQSKRIKRNSVDYPSLNCSLINMLLPKRLAESAMATSGHHQPQLRSQSVSTCGLHQQSRLQFRGFDRSIACVQADQQAQVEVVQQECCTSGMQQAAPADTLAAAHAAHHRTRPAAKTFVRHLHSRLHKLGAWCRRHRLQHLLWG